MKSFLGFLVVLFLAFPVYAQTARQDLKDDPAVVAEGFTDAEKDVLVDIVKARAERDAAAKSEQDALKRMEEMLEADPQLKMDLMNE